MKKRASFFKKLGGWFKNITAKPKCDEEGMATGGTLNKIKCHAKNVVGVANGLLNGEGRVARIA